MTPIPVKFGHPHFHSATPRKPVRKGRLLTDAARNALVIAVAVIFGIALGLIGTEMML